MRHITLSLVCLLTLPACMGGNIDGGDAQTSGTGEATLGGGSNTQGTTAGAGTTTGSTQGTTGGSGNQGSTGGGNNGNSTLDIPTAPTRGAAVPCYEYEAESAVIQGVVLQPNRTFGTIASESSGRSAVQLNSTGDYVQLTTQHTANSIVVRYVVPDNGNATLGVYVNGTRHTLALTSRYSWTYGSADAQGSGSESAGAGTAHHFYDEAHLMFNSVGPGAVIKIQRDAQDTASYYVIDLIDLEDVAAPGTKPSTALSITDYGAIANDGQDDSSAIQAAISAAITQNVEVWIPSGTFDTKANNSGGATTYKLFATGVTIRGAGMWYSVIQGYGAQFEVSQNSNGSYATSTRPTQFFDFGLFGDVTYRDDTKGWQGFDGPWGTNGLVHNVWIEHQTAGIWVGSGPVRPPINTSLTNGLTVSGARIRNTYADGVNFADATSNSKVLNSSFRNNGDDSVVTWSYASDGPLPCAHNEFGFNTVQLPWRANCFAAYGGQDSNFHDSTCADTLAYPGMMLSTSTNFNSMAFTGTTYATNITLTRSGGAHYNQPYGALYVQAASGTAPNINITGIDIPSPSYYGIHITTSGQQIQAAALSKITVSGWQAAGDLHQMATADPLSAIWVMPGSTGSATLTNVTLSSPLSGDIGFQNDSSSAFTVTLGAGNTGF